METRERYELTNATLQVQTWFTNLVKDRDVLMSTKIDMKVMSDIVAQSGATITNFFNFWVKTEKHSQTVLDVGVLRFPDIDNPYFKVRYFPTNNRPSICMLT